MHPVLDHAQTVDDRARYYLTLWGKWWREEEMPNLGYPKKCTVLAATARYADWEGLVDAADHASALAADATLQSMILPLRTVLAAYYGGTINYGNFDNFDLTPAHEDFMIRMNRKGYL